MAVFEQNTIGLKDALEEIKKIPDAALSDILTDELKMTAIQDQFTSLYYNRKVGDGTASVSYWKDNDKSNRDTLNRAIVYYKARIDWLADADGKGKNFGHTKDNIISCFGEDGVSWINQICQDAGIAFEKKIKTEQEQEAEQEAAQTAVKRHESGNPIADKPVEQPKIGTAFLANNMQFTLYTPNEAFQMPERAAIIDDYFFADTISLLYGQAGSLKTWFALWEGVSLALGKELCGMPINDDGHRILYISLEMTAKGLADRLSGMIKDLDEVDRKKVNDNFIIISAENTPGMKATDDFLTALEQLCQDQHFDVIYIDAFADFIAGYDIRSEDDMTAVIDKLRTFVLKNNVSFRIIHHGTKPTQDSNGSMAGIHTIRDLVDYVFLIKAEAENEIKITSDMNVDRSAKARYSAAMKMVLKFISDDGCYSFKRIQDNETASQIEKIKNIKQLISENQGINSTELRKLTGNTKDHTAIINNLITAGDIIMNPEKSNSGQKTNCYYTTEYWSEKQSLRKP